MSDSGGYLDSIIEKGRSKEWNVAWNVLLVIVKKPNTIVSINGNLSDSS